MGLISFFDANHTCAESENDVLPSSAPERRSLSSSPFKIFGTGRSKKHTEAGFNERYELNHVLGKGAFSTVYHAVDRATGKEWACKMVTEQAKRELLLREVDILQQLEHPNLLQYREHFNTPEHLYIITELLEGSDLLAGVLERGSYAEDDARDVIRQMLNALSYLDSKGIAHRDLKMENVVLTSSLGSTQIKIIDFGLAEQLSDRKAAFDVACGTPMYYSPEMASSLPYGTRCDVWAAGVVLFMLLSGDFPFEANTVSGLLSTLRRAQIRFTDPVWELVSHDAKHLVKTLLTAKADERPTAREALAHPWLAQ
jgi:serine/threonine protein kinase